MLCITLQALNVRCNSRLLANAIPNHFFTLLMSADISRQISLTCYASKKQTITSIILCVTFIIFTVTNLKSDRSYSTYLCCLFLTCPIEKLNVNDVGHLMVLDNRNMYCTVFVPIHFLIMSKQNKDYIDVFVVCAINSMLFL